MIPEERGRDGDECAFCGETDDLETHHIIPRKFGGTDDDVNLLRVCGHCHKVLERTYDYRFYQGIGVMADMTPPVMFDTIKELQWAVMNMDSALRGRIGWYESSIEYTPSSTVSDYGDTIARKEVLKIKRDAIQEVIDGEGVSCNYPSHSEIQGLVDGTEKLIDHVEESL